jgi:hypothetical protein
LTLRINKYKLKIKEEEKHEVHKGDGLTIDARAHRQRRTSGHHLDIDGSSFLIVLRV